MDAPPPSPRQNTTHVHTLRPSKVLARRLAAALAAESTASKATKTYPTPGFSCGLVVLGRGMCTDLTLPNFSHSSCPVARKQKKHQRVPYKKQVTFSMNVLDGISSWMKSQHMPTLSRTLVEPWLPAPVHTVCSLRPQHNGSLRSNRFGTLATNGGTKSVNINFTS